MAERQIYTGDSENKLIIMRGLPGSGKSTLAGSYGGLVFSTDDFFMKDGIYQFDPSKIGEAHLWNQERTKQAVNTGNPLVVVDNTNVCAWELRPYAEMGVDQDYSIFLAQSDAPHKWNVDRLSKLNSHGVRKEVIQKMKDSFEHNLTLDQILQARSPYE